MKTTASFFLAAQLSLLHSAQASLLNPRARCNNDNCARAATGSFDGKQAARTSACSSFQACTVIPATITVTNVVNVTPEAITTTFTATTVVSTEISLTTVTLDANLNLDKRAAGYGHLRTADKRDENPIPDAATTICPVQVPATASACSGIVRYASACSCAGITKSYTTLAAPSTTLDLTSTLVPSTTTLLATASTVVTNVQTATVTVIPAPVEPSNFQVQLNFPAGSDANSAQYQGLYLALDRSFGEWSATPQSSAISFTLNSDSNIVSIGYTGASSDRVAVAVTIGTAVFIVWDTLQHYRDSNVSFPFTKCTTAPSELVPGSAQLLCTPTRGRIAAICDPDQWNSLGGAGSRSDAFVVFFVPGASHAGCYPFELTQVAL